MRAVTLLSSTTTTTEEATSNLLEAGDSARSFFRKSGPLVWRKPVTLGVILVVTSPMADALLSSSRSPLEVVPTPAVAVTPVAMPGITNRREISRLCFSCLAMTETSPPAVTRPSKKALVDPFSTTTASAIPTLPSSPEVERARVRLRSMVSAWTVMSSSASIVALPVTWAVALELMTLTETAPAMPAIPLESETTLRELSILERTVTSPLAFTVPAKVVLEVVTTTPTATPTTMELGATVTLPMALLWAVKSRATIRTPSPTSTWASETATATPATTESPSTTPMMALSPVPRYPAMSLLPRSLGLK